MAIEVAPGLLLSLVKNMIGAAVPVFIYGMFPIIALVNKQCERKKTTVATITLSIVYLGSKGWGAENILSMSGSICDYIGRFNETRVCFQKQKIHGLT